MKKRIVKKTGNKYAWKLELEKDDVISIIIYILVIAFMIFQLVRWIKEC